MRKALSRKIKDVCILSPSEHNALTNFLLEFIASSIKSWREGRPPWPFSALRIVFDSGGGPDKFQTVRCVEKLLTSMILVSNTMKQSKNAVLKILRKHNIIEFLLTDSIFPVIQ